MSGDREAVLARIREALREPAPRHHAKVHPAPAGATVTAPFREWLPKVGASPKERVALFAQLSEMLRTDFRSCASSAEAGDCVAQLAQEHGWKRLATHAGDLNAKILKQLPPGLEVLQLAPGYDRNTLEASDAGLTECECLVAQTGSICVSALSSGGRTLSVLPPHHIVVARRRQLVPDLTAAYELLAEKYAPNYPSFMTFITGPSRTGDIERILVLGAHGPKKLTVLLVP